MPTYKKQGSHRCFDMSQDINWHGNADNLWGSFRQKFPQYEKYTNKELKFLMDNFWKYCAKVLIETKDGIVLDRIGYLSLTVYNTSKKMLKWYNKVIPNFKSDGLIYSPYFYPIRKHKTPFKGWAFTINYSLKSRIKEKIHGGFKYYNHIKVLDKNPKAIKSN